jgi:predicted NBD/HSP70 family sugar kinase
VAEEEGGHVCLDYSPFAPLCGCGRRGCVEAIAGGKAVERRIVAELEARGLEPSKLMHLNGLPTDASLSTLLDQAYWNKHLWALEIYRIITTAMGRYLADLQTQLHLPAIIWKGTFAQKALRLPGIEEAIRQEMRQHLINPRWEEELRFYFVPQPPMTITDSEAFIGAAHLAASLIPKPSSCP